MRITVLGYLERETARKPDVVVPQVAEALRQGGHEVTVLGVHGDVNKMIAGLAETAPDLIFNLMEMFGEDLFGAVAVVGLLDLLDLPYTGGGPGEFYLQEDKVLTKKMLDFEGVPYPPFAVFTRDGDVEARGQLRVPLFVKPLRGDASIGIDYRSFVTSTREMMERILSIHDKFNDDALVEEYIDGREFAVGVLGNQNPVALPPIEVDFSGLPPGAPRILDARAKWHKDSVEYKGTKVVVPTLPAELRAKVESAAVGAYRALRVRDYGRVDLRVTDSGEVFVIEVNASCYLEKSGEFVMAAGAAGLDYASLVNRIVELAVDRFQRREQRRRRKGRARAPKPAEPAAEPVK
jgi:D-alanine-D-alanine ligase